MKHISIDPQLSDTLFNALSRSGRPLRLDVILRVTRLPRKRKGEILLCLQNLAEDGRLIRIKGGSWVTADALKRVVGRLAVQRSGAAYLLREDKGTDVRIDRENLAGAWNGDKVEVILLPSVHGTTTEGRVFSILERGVKELVVRMENFRKGILHCRPVDPRFDFDLEVELPSDWEKPEASSLLRVEPLEEIKNGYRAARAVAFLGMETDAAVQERITKLNNGIPEAFPDDVLEDAEKCAVNPLPDAHREDLRQTLLVTIDGEDAKDFDDAICVWRDGNSFHLIVAIADVSAYVHPGSATDREARERGNSYYFPTSVEPMLPEVLCNGVCSLRPHEERNCLAVDMTLDAAGKLTASRMASAVMASHARLTYEEVQAVLDNPGSEAEENLERKAPGVPAMLHEAASLAEILIARRKKAGGLDFDLPEAEFRVERTENGFDVTGIRNRERLFAHRLIEAFMVRANECVAEFLEAKGEHLLYRTHPEPDRNRLDDLKRVLKESSVSLPSDEGLRYAQWMGAVLDVVAETDASYAVSRLILRTMMQARYDPVPSGHFGLASFRYCHFTSPIRRYADLLVHRALRHALGLSTGGPLPEFHAMEGLAEQCNARERIADDAEHEICRRMGCLLLRNREGAIFEGIISGIMRFGFFVRLDGMPVEGMVHVETLSDDFYAYDETRQELCGVRNGEIFRIGRRVAVKLLSVNIELLEINLEYQKEEGEKGRRAFAKRKGFHKAGDVEKGRGKRFDNEDRHDFGHDGGSRFSGGFGKKPFQHREFEEGRASHQDSEQDFSRSFVGKKRRFGAEGRDERSQNRFGAKRGERNFGEESSPRFERKPRRFDAENGDEGRPRRFGAHGEGTSFTDEKSFSPRFGKKPRSRAFDGNDEKRGFGFEKKAPRFGAGSFKKGAFEKKTFREESFRNDTFEEKENISWRKFGDRPSKDGMERPVRSFDLKKDETSFAEEKSFSPRFDSDGEERPLSSRFGKKPRRFDSDFEGERSFAPRFGKKPRRFGTEDGEKRPQSRFGATRDEKSFGDESFSSPRFGKKPRRFGAENGDGDRPRRFGGHGESFSPRFDSDGEAHPFSSRFGKKPRHFGTENGNDRPQHRFGRPTDFGHEKEGFEREDFHQKERKTSYGDRFDEGFRGKGRRGKPTFERGKFSDAAFGKPTEDFHGRRKKKSVSRGAGADFFRMEPSEPRSDKHGRKR